ncbi:hypothetical protein DFO46_1378 [Rhizobium sp. AG855]|nr:hypothetical protein DFO46_1378 [Rhizobium sp. AG855]
MMRSAILLLLMASTSLAALPQTHEDEAQHQPALATGTPPCLEPKRVWRYVVTWVIENKRTGERRGAGSQEVRIRC